jgi:hypothetical protein
LGGAVDVSRRSAFPCAGFHVALAGVRLRFSIPWSITLDPDNVAGGACRRPRADQRQGSERIVPESATLALLGIFFAGLRLRSTA